MAKNTFTQADDDLIRAFYAKGKGPRYIAEEMGRPRTTVETRARKLGLTKPKGILAWSLDMEDQLRRLVNEGMTGREIARTMGLSRSKVLGKITRMKLVMSDANRAKLWTMDEKQYLIDNHKTATASDMSAHLGRRYNSTNKMLRTMGLTPKKASTAPKNRTPKPRLTGIVPPVVKACAPPPSESMPETARPWQTRKFGECHYPYGERGAIHSCCAPTWKGTSYCEGHAALCGGYRVAA